MRGRRSVRCGQTCEYRKARLILTHDPGEELFLGALHPAAALFREHIDILNAILEQDLEKSCRLLSDHIHLSYQEAINTMMHSSF